MIFYLIGYPYSGKTTLAQNLSRKFGIKYIDTDEYIQQTIGKDIFDIFEYGEEYFRKIERNCLIEIGQSISKDENVIISVGGGLPTYKDNMDILNRTGITFYLKTSFNVIFKRFLDDPFSRPRFKNLIFGKTSDAEKIIFDDIKEREKYYLKSNIIIDNDEGINFEWSELESSWEKGT